MNTSLFLPVKNASAVRRDQIPLFPVEQLVELTADMLEQDLRLCTWCGIPEAAGTSIFCVLADDQSGLLYLGASAPVRARYKALTPKAPQAHLFERELYEQHGLLPEGHPWLKPVRAHKNGAPEQSAFFRVEGTEIHEVAVGPVHAGIIEPGHFRFQCAGEEVLHLEIALGYQHRGIEEALYGGPFPRSPFHAETIAGDTSIAHATAYAQILEACSKKALTPKAHWVRALALELERLANHTGDLGALALDVAFLPTSSACGKIRGDFLNLTAALCGNRFGRNLIRPGGYAQDVSPSVQELLSTRLQNYQTDLQEALAWFWDSPSVCARFQAVGSVSLEDARAMGLSGIAAKASGLMRDCRKTHPTGWYAQHAMPITSHTDGDIFARAKIRSQEIGHSLLFLEELLSRHPEGEKECMCPAPGPHLVSVSLVEGWRGEVCHMAVTDDHGRFLRYKITDPSFHNWTGLALALRGTAVSDFPICNKSFNLSYCGFDL